MSNVETETMYKIMFANQPDILTVAQVQQILGTSRHFAYDLITEEKLKALRIGNAYKVPKICLIDYVLENLKELDNKNSVRNNQ